jgi:hypothetical protein
MNLFDSFVAAETDYRRVPTERLSHPKDGALAQAAGKSRSTSTMLVSVFVSFAADGCVFATVTSSKRDLGQNLADRAGPVDHRIAVASPEQKECWFEPTPRGTFFLFLVQDRLRASDVLHRDWGWSLWL